MNPIARRCSFITGALVIVGGLFLLPGIAWPHCDTLDGPVVTDARAALESGEIAPVLKWVRGEDEVEIRSAFEKALAVRQKYPEVSEFSDMYFFETLVRVHRAGEGAAYDGLKPAGQVEPGIHEADVALEEGSVRELVSKMTEVLREGIETRFAHTMETKAHRDESVEAGREYVAAYVDFIHYIERLHMDATAGASHHGEAAPDDAAHAHGH
jgi:hypothetical protein